MAASFVIPGFTIDRYDQHWEEFSLDVFIHRLTWLTSQVGNIANITATNQRRLITFVVLASIPIISRPIDNLVNYLMDNTYRKYFTA